MSQAYRKSLLAGSSLLAAFALLSVPAAVAHGRDPANIPPPSGAHPGQCFAKVREDVVEHYSDRVLVTPASSVSHTIPAVTRVVEKTVVVSPASEQTIVHPAVFRTVDKTVTEPGRTQQIDTPARYRLVTRRILIAPAHTVWKQGSGRPVTGEPTYGQTAYVATGQVLCSVLIPARYATKSERVLVAPAEHRTVQGRPIVRHLSERVQVSPERVEKIPHPAITRTVRETVIVTPARTETTPVPAQYRTIDRTRTVGRYGWKLVVCAPKPAPHYAPRPAPRTYQPLPYVAPQDMGRRSPYGERG